MEGPARDIDEYEEIGFPVFSRFTTPHTARGRVYEQSFGEPIQVGEARVAAGDYVIADASGIVFIPCGTSRRSISLLPKNSGKRTSDDSRCTGGQTGFGSDGHQLRKHAGKQISSINIKSLIMSDRNIERAANWIQQLSVTRWTNYALVVSVWDQAKRS